MQEEMDAEEAQRLARGETTARPHQHHNDYYDEYEEQS